MFNRILVAIDDSTASRAGLTAAVQLAKDHRATLLALHVVDVSPITGGYDGDDINAASVDGYYKRLRKHGDDVLEKASALAKASGIVLEAAIVESMGETVASLILQHARKLKADVIVIGTHGRRGLRRMVMGSDAEAVVREASVPVLLVRGDEDVKSK